MNTGKQLRAVAVTTMLMGFFAPAVLAQTQKPPQKPETPSESGVKLQPFNIKPGLWESTRTISHAGDMPIPAETLNRMTPEQRAALEARMKANSAAHTNTTTEKSCVTREQIEDQKLDFGGNDACTTTIISSTSTTAKGKVSCSTEGLRGNGIFEVESSDPEHYKGSAHSTLTANGHTMHIDINFTSKWLGARCGDVK